MHITDEIRTYSRNGNIVEVSLERLHQDKSKITDHRKIACDGNPVTVEKQTVSCKFTAPNVIEGESSPPLQYSRSEIIDGRLTIGVFKETKRRKPDEKYVYDKVK